ncbi:MAG TPA: MarR family transcriptional regulator, partial [Polyangiaceae bacterium]
MKRAHLGGERLGRGLLKEFELTPARFDLLNTIVDCEAQGDAMTQAELWKRLGVVRSAVCEMVKELVRVGILKRHRRTAKSRTWIIQMTELGRRLQKTAYDELINNGVATQYVNSSITNEHETDPAPRRYALSPFLFSVGAKLGNRVQRNSDLYLWDYEEFYADLITPEDRDMYFGDLPWVDELPMEELLRREVDPN